MKKVSLFILIILFAGIFQPCVNNNNPHHRGNNPHMTSKPDTTIHYLQEKHLKNIKQLTAAT